MHIAVMDNKGNPDYNAPASDLVRYIREKYPDLDIKTLFRGEFAKAVLGDLPDYSNRDNYMMTNVTTATVHAFVICFYKDQINQKTYFILQKRRELNQAGVNKLGALGGFVNLDTNPDKKHPNLNDAVTIPGEQPADCAVREIAEEAVDNNKKPLLQITPDRLHLLHSGVDYRGCDENTQRTQNTGYALELSSDEFNLICKHAQQIDQDPAYKQVILDNTDNETHGFLVIEGVDLHHLQADNFAHPHEYHALMLAHNKMQSPDATWVRHPF